MNMETKHAAIMHPIKQRNMRAAYDGHAGDQTVKAVMDGLPADCGGMTGKQLGIMMSAINAAYHRGKAAAGAEVVDDCVWVGGKLIPLDVIARLVKTERDDVVECGWTSAVPCYADGKRLSYDDEQRAMHYHVDGKYTREVNHVETWQLAAE